MDICRFQPQIAKGVNKKCDWKMGKIKLGLITNIIEMGIVAFSLNYLQEHFNPL